MAIKQAKKEEREAKSAMLPLLLRIKITREINQAKKKSDLLAKISLQASSSEFVWRDFQLPFLTLTEKVSQKARGKSMITG